MKKASVVRLVFSCFVISSFLNGEQKCCKTSPVKDVFWLKNKIFCLCTNFDKSSIKQKGIINVNYYSKLVALKISTKAVKI